MIPVEISRRHLCILYLLLTCVCLSTSQTSESTDPSTGMLCLALPLVQSPSPIHTSVDFVVHVLIPNERQMVSILPYDSQLLGY